MNALAFADDSEHGVAASWPKMSDTEFHAFCKLAQMTFGLHLPAYKRNMVYRRLSRRVNALGLKSFDSYISLLNGPLAGTEIQHFINALTTNKTEFFRESHHFTHLQTIAVPEILSRKSTRDIQIWSAGCSTGQEPYSIAMTLMQMQGHARFDARITATDIDTDVLATAKAGTYSRVDCESIEDRVLKKYFLPSEDSMTANSVLKSCIAFQPLNLNSDWRLPAKFDVIFCRNVVIYFDKPTQQILYDRLANQLNRGGYIYIGHSESLYRVTDRFEAAGQSTYRKVS